MPKPKKVGFSKCIKKYPHIYVVTIDIGEKMIVRLKYIASNFAVDTATHFFTMLKC
jgi:hypothetical protein